MATQTLGIIDIRPAVIGKPVVSTAYEASHSLKGAPGYLYTLLINFHTASYRTLMFFDQSSAVAPVNGAVTPYFCIEGITQSTDSAESFKSVDFTWHPLFFTKGIFVICSTSTSGCTTLTADGSNMWYNAQVQ